MFSRRIKPQRVPILLSIQTFRSLTNSRLPERHDANLRAVLPPSDVRGVRFAGAGAGLNADALPGSPRVRRHGELPEFKSRPGGGSGG